VRNQLSCGYSIIGAAMLGYEEFNVAPVSSEEVEYDRRSDSYYTRRGTNSAALEGWLKGCGFRCKVRKFAGRDICPTRFGLVAVLK